MREWLNGDATHLKISTNVYVDKRETKNIFGKDNHVKTINMINLCLKMLFLPVRIHSPLQSHSLSKGQMWHKEL